MSRVDIKVLPSLEVLRHLFVYDPETGVLRWRVQPHPQARRSTPGTVAGTVGAHGYWVVKVGPKYYYVHRIVWKMQTGVDPVDQIDHRDRNKLNNRFANFREVSNGQNQQNVGLRKSNTTGVKGVCPMPGSVWKAYISINSKQIKLGSFKTIEAAAAARRRAEEILHGEYARSA